MASTAYDDLAVSGIGVVGNPGYAQQIAATPLTAPLGIPSPQPALIVGMVMPTINGSTQGIIVPSRDPVFSDVNNPPEIVAPPYVVPIKFVNTDIAGVQIVQMAPTIDVYHNANGAPQGPGVPAPSQSPQGISQTFIAPTQTLLR